MPAPPRITRRSPYALVLVLLCASACTAHHPPAPPESVRPVVLSTDSSAPAPPIPGARPGGTVTVLLGNGFEHLDPARTYVSRAQMTNLLLQRTLTTFRHRPDGRVELVGDLATDTGHASDTARVWTFTLRKGLKFGDGTPITSHDVAYGIARSFSPALPDGPTYLQQWLADTPDFSRRYQGPYAAGSALPPGVSTPDPHTIVLRFARSHTDVPFVAALGNTTPVPRLRDTRTGYDTHPVATGPYQIETYEPNKRLILVRNPYWNPATDPVRTAYPDRFEFIFGQTATVATTRILTAHGTDQTAVSLQQVPSELLLTVTDNRALAANATVGPTPYVIYLKINTERVTDVRVRQALNCAFDRDGYINTIGGRGVAEPATTILPKIATGYHRYNAYDCGPSGDPDKAQHMLGGRRVALRYGFRDAGQGPTIAAFMQTSLAKAGFDLTLVPIPQDDYYSTLGTRDNKLDIYTATWGGDWPTGQTVIPPLLDGRTITAHGNHNSSYFNNAQVNAEIDRIETIPDPDQAAQAWGVLDETIMRTAAPLVPVYYDRSLTLNATHIGGLHLHNILGVTSLENAFIR